MGTCLRFRADGRPCRNKTDHTDGWCRHPGCSGFLRRSHELAPPVEGTRTGTARHVAAAGDGPAKSIDVGDVPDVRVTLKAIESFRFHHGGGAAAAEVEIRDMLEDFLMRSAQRQSRGGYLTLAREGFELTISPGHDVVVAYQTVHRERTWSQVKIGVPSRFKRPGKGRRPRAEAPAPAPAVEWTAESQVLASIDTRNVHLTGRVLRNYERMFDAQVVDDDQLDRALRDVLASDLQTPEA